ncbi:uncharacterized protein LOC124371507 [Homalodisca vitripennis]|uniref:uncharacterized protein LOC124371507 n=1 Tax=Homalodisca vitripennis TaxID=197043 RepID=UPI001EEAE558|nr:uncharacterized protein LOC124371507 [Homalodisca vitripennis]
METITEELSGETYPTTSMVIPLIRSVQYVIKSLSPETDVAIYLKNKLQEVIHRRFSAWEQNKIASKATFLDPRFMKTSFGLKENADRAEKLIMEELEFNIKNKSDSAPSSEEIIEEVQETEETVSEQATQAKTKLARRQNLWKWVDSRIEEKKKNQVSSSIASTALIVRHYIELPQPKRWENPLPFCRE